MTSISTLIDFLMSLMRDEDTKRSFERDPGGTMAGKGLHDVSAEDVRDARLIMADTGHARPRPDGGQQGNGFHDGGLTAGGGNGAVREILHTTNTFEIDQSKTIFNVDNHRTTILDSFNSADKVTAIQDNDTVIDIDEDGDEDGDQTGETEDRTEDPTEDGTGEPRDGDEQDPPGDLPSDPAPPTDSEPADVPGDPAPPASADPEVPMPEADPNEAYPTEPEPVHDDAPVPFEDPESEDLPVA